MKKLEEKRFLSVKDLAYRWNRSEDTIRRMFEDDPRVLRLGREETRFKRRYIAIRIPPEVVLEIERTRHC